MKIESAEHFVQLRQSDDPAEYRIATWGEASEPTWFDVIERYPAMRRWVAQNKTLPEPVRIELARDTDVRVRYAIATTPGLEISVLAILVNDMDASIRRAIVTHEALPIEALEELIQDSDPDVAADAAEQLEWLRGSE